MLHTYQQALTKNKELQTKQVEVFHSYTDHEMENRELIQQLKKEIEEKRLAPNMNDVPAKEEQSPIIDDDHEEISTHGFEQRLKKNITNIAIIKENFE